MYQVPPWIHEASGRKDAVTYSPDIFTQDSEVSYLPSAEALKFETPRPQGHGLFTTRTRGSPGFLPYHYFRREAEHTRPLSLAPEVSEVFHILCGR